MRTYRGDEREFTITRREREGHVQDAGLEADASEGRVASDMSDNGLRRPVSLQFVTPSQQ